MSARGAFALLAAVAGAAAALTCAPDARAGIEDTFALGPAPMALAGSYAARPGDYAAAYYNPAGLAPGGAAEHGAFFEGSIAFVYGHPNLSVTGSKGQNLPLTQNPYDTAGALIGARFSVGQPFHLDGLDGGLAVYLPGHAFEWSIQPDDSLQWALLTDRTQVVSINLGLAYRVASWLSLGLGLRVGFDVVSNITGEVTSVNYKTDHAQSQVGDATTVTGHAAPLAGLLVTPAPGLRVGFAYRGESSIDDRGTAVISSGQQLMLGNLGYAFHFNHYFEPHQFTLAVGADLGKSFDFSADLTYARWSDALSTNRNTFGCGPNPCDGPSPIWGDTWTPAFGARWKPAPVLAVMAGYRYQRSPLDNFGGPSNLLDNDRHVPSAGLSVDLSRVVSSLDMRVVLGAQLAELVTRTETKDFRFFPSQAALTGNPGYPSVTYGGNVLGGSLGVEGRW